MLMSGRQYIDVVGMARPWPIPTGWWEHARQRVRELVADPRVGASQNWTGWPVGTRDVAPFLQNLAMSLGGYVAIFSGEFAQFPEQLVDEFLASGQRREPMVARNWYLTDCEWPLFLIKYAAPDPVSRRAALELSYDCVTFLSEVGPLQTRALALLGIYERVLHSGNLLEYHLTAPFPEVARLWRQSLLSETELALLPEIGGWGAALKWSYAGLGAAHDHLSESTGRVETLPEVVASMALCDNLESLPATLAVAVGPEDFAEISAAHDAHRPVFDPDRLAAAESGLAGSGHAGRRDRRLPRLAGHGGAGVPGGGRTARAAEAVLGPRHGRLRHRRRGAVRGETRCEPADQGPGRTGRPAPPRCHDRASSVGSLARWPRRRRSTTRMRTTDPEVPRGRDRRPAGRARRSRRAGPRQAAGPAPGGRGDRRPAPAQRRNARSSPFPPHRLHRESRDGQDHGGPAAGQDLRPAGHAVARSPRRGQPGRSGRPVHRTDRAQGPQDLQPGRRRRALHRRGALADSARLPSRLRGGGRFHPAQADGGPAGRGGGHRRRLSERDGGLHGLESRPGVAFPEDLDVRQLRRRRALRDLRADRCAARVRTGCRGRGAGPRAHPRSASAGLRQRPLHAEPVRGGHLDSGRAADRPARCSPRRSSGPCSPRTCPPKLRRIRAGSRACISEPHRASVRSGSGAARLRSPAATVWSRGGDPAHRRNTLRARRWPPPDGRE